LRCFLPASTLLLAVLAGCGGARTAACEPGLADGSARGDGVASRSCPAGAASTRPGAARSPTATARSIPRRSPLSRRRAFIAVFAGAGTPEVEITYEDGRTVRR
jgi:hypothetical protein